MPILGFEGEYRFLSNFYPCKILIHGWYLDTLEHAYQLSKTKIRHEQKDIAFAKSPGEAKRLGALVTKREDWKEIKISVMRSLLMQKFENPELKKMLLLTGDEYLEETNKHGDIFWGVCDGDGENHLGILLMEVRAELRLKHERNAANRTGS